MLTLVVPMAGAGSRFAKAGYDRPKPLIDVGGRPMIDVVVGNLRPTRPHRFVFIVQRAHDLEFGIVDELRRIEPAAEVVTLDGLTDGAARTVLAAAQLLDGDDEVVVANSDQYVDDPIDRFLEAADGLDGAIMTMTADDPKWSYVRIDDDGLVAEVREKEVISHEATVGIYHFARWDAFRAAAEAMIGRGERSNGEYYVAPVYNDLIAAGARIGTHNVGVEQDGMYGLGIPDDLDWFLAHHPAAR